MKCGLLSMPNKRTWKTHTVYDLEFIVNLIDEKARAPKKRDPQKRELLMFIQSIREAYNATSRLPSL
jgi:hypothetical protein